MKKIIFYIISGVLFAGIIGMLVWQFLRINKIEKQNTQYEKFIKTNFDMDIKDWDGKKVIFDEAELIDQVSDAIDQTFGVYVEGDDIEEFIENLYNELDGGYYDEIHELYDTTAILEAYESGNTENLSEEDLYTLEKAMEIIDEIIEDDMTEYEKEKAVYDWLVGYVSYDEDAFNPLGEDVYEYNYYPYGVLKYHSAICVGNATTFKLFMDMLGIDCMIIHSTEEGEHAWNLVCIEGDWYHVDATFDSGTSTDTPGYEYFNVPDSFKEYDGYWWDTDEFPEANSIKYSYIAQDAVEVESLEEIPQLVRDALDNDLRKLVLKANDEVTGVETLIDEISMRLPDSQYVYLMNEAEHEGVCYYVIEVYKDEYLEDDWEDEWEDDYYEDLDDELLGKLDEMF